MVAETIMKKLYNRNKELEKWYESNQQHPSSPLPILTGDTNLACVEPDTPNCGSPSSDNNSPVKDKFDDIIGHMKAKQRELEDELKLKDQQIVKLTDQKMDKDSTKFAEFQQTRLDECLQENARYFRKYVEIREFAYLQIEDLLR